LPIIVHDHKSLNLNGVTYALGHLKPRIIFLKEQGKDCSDICVRISFLSHVYSKSPDFGIKSDFKDEIGKERNVCPDRYQRSVNLPDYCENSILNNWLTWESRDRNSISNYMLATDNSSAKYAVYYRLAPSLLENCDVEFIVKSAYVTNYIKYNPRKFNVKSLIKKCYFEGRGLP
jgi:hypothetical protein